TSSTQRQTLYAPKPPPPSSAAQRAVSARALLAVPRVERRERRGLQAPHAHHPVAVAPHLVLELLPEPAQHERGGDAVAHDAGEACRTPARHRRRGGGKEEA